MEDVSRAMATRMELKLPAWLRDEPLRGFAAGSDAERMRLAIDLAARNVAEGTGGPFGAAVFDEDSGMLVSVGVNLVVNACSSVAHAEIVAVALAQAAMGLPRLRETGGSFALFSSAQPCAMCTGAILWSGVTRLVYGASRDDVERLTGFDEGPIVDDWREEMAARGVSVDGPLLHEEACVALSAYAVGGGTLY